MRGCRGSSESHDAATVPPHRPSRRCRCQRGGTVLVTGDPPVTQALDVRGCSRARSRRAPRRGEGANINCRGRGIAAELAQFAADRSRFQKSPRELTRQTRWPLVNSSSGRRWRTTRSPRRRAGSPCRAGRTNAPREDLALTVARSWRTKSVRPAVGRFLEGHVNSATLQPLERATPRGRTHCG